MSIKLDTTKNIAKMQRNEDYQLCGTYTDSDKKKEFCTSIDAEDQIECFNLAHETSNTANKIFCEFCCEYKIGSMHLVDRDRCIKEKCPKYN